jgi:hypothetical protein
MRPASSSTSTIGRRFRNVAEFILDPAFEATSAALGELPLCHARLQLDARYAWIALIPRIGGMRELEDLTRADREQLMEETVLAGAAVRAVSAALGLAIDKLNVGALGNVTPSCMSTSWAAGSAIRPGPDRFGDTRRPRPIRLTA